MTRLHTVARGDTLGEIARAHGVSAEALMRANGFDPGLADGRVSAQRADPDRLMPGQRLVIPAATPGYERTLLTQVGDTLRSLAERWGVSVAGLRAANPQLAAPAGAGNAALDGITTPGASARTARQDRLAAGVDASHQMARTDEARVMRHAALFDDVGARFDLPPALLAAIASRESRGGAALDARGYGDAGHGFGLMQVDDRNGFAVATAGGPAGHAHLEQAASILRDKLDAVREAYPDLAAADQLRLAVSRYNGGRGTPGDFDRGTTGGDYSADVIARAQYYAGRWPGGEAAASATTTPATTTPATTAAGLPDTRTLSEAQRFELYADHVQASGDATARADLAAGQRVVLGLRVDTALDANQGRGRYDDRIVVLWRDAQGQGHVREYAASTEPSSQYAARGYGADINGDGRRELGRLQEGSLRYSRDRSSRLGDVLRPQAAYAVLRDTNHDQRLGAGDRASRTGSDFLFHAGGRNSTGSAGCQTMAPGDFRDFWAALGGQRELSYVLVNVTPR